MNLRIGQTPPDIVEDYWANHATTVGLWFPVADNLRTLSERHDVSTETDPDPST